MHLGFRVFGALNPKSMFEHECVGCGCLKMRTRPLTGSRDWLGLSSGAAVKVPPWFGAVYPGLQDLGSMCP